MTIRPTVLTALVITALVTGQPSEATQPDEGAHPATSSATNGHCRQPGPYQLPHGGTPVHLDPDDFTTRIDHPYWPMRPGTVWTFVETKADGIERIRVRVTHRTEIVQGIRARVVRDVVRSAGEVIEATDDWYAQDSGGSIWYLGENTKEYENGEVVSTEGSWRHGRDSAQAGIILPARPATGCSYREEFLAREAEDRAFVLSRRESVKVPTGFYRRVLHTANWTPLSPTLLENKFYARGVGPILELDVSPTASRAELVDISRP